MTGWRGFNLGFTLACALVAVLPCEAPENVTFWVLAVGLNVVLVVSEAKGWHRP